MKLLIVDDQANVVEALTSGVDWDLLGFTEVDKAYNALDAKESMLKKEADVMLCDIEMPGESGLDLFRWVRDTEKMKTKCIFLTSHANFQYAQEAVRLGAFDYILQPAPYTQIREAVSHAVAKSLVEMNQTELNRLGRLFIKQGQEISGNIFCDFLTGNAEVTDYSELEKVGLLPSLSEAGALLLIQVIRNSNDLPSSLLAFAIGNVSNEILCKENIKSICAFERNANCYILAIQNNDGSPLEYEKISGMIRYLQSTYEKYLKISTAIYVQLLDEFSKAPQQWEDMLKKKMQNVTLETGVFKVDGLAQGKGEHVAEIKTWRKLLEDGYGETVEVESFKLLDEMTEEKRLDLPTLSLFYHDFVTAISLAAHEKQGRLDDMLKDPDNAEIYRNAMFSVENMKAFIHMIVPFFTDKDDMDQDFRLDEVKAYINKNLDRDIKRDDIAQRVHMNPDYLTRVFKKNTGMTLKEYVILRKMEEARSLIRTTNLPISYVAAKVGYVNFSHFSSTYKKTFGVTPNEDR